MDLAWTALEGIEIEELVRCSGAVLRGDDIVLPTLASETVVEMRERMVMTPPDLGGGWGLIALHHLKGSLNWKRDEEWTSFEQMKGARPFAPAFRSRAIAPLAVHFGESPEELWEAGRRLGGRPLSMGDAAIVLQVFPRMSFAAVIWQGDDEVPPGANILFDRGGAATLPAEDMAEMGISLVARLISTAR